MNPTVKRNFIWLTVFSIAMGYLETAVVVYARMIYFPDGFDFPMVPIESNFAVTEFFREIATIIMLIGAGYMAGKKAVTRFAYFIYCFAIWDIFYYVFLKVLLDWPSSFFTHDLLFLVPVPWVGPVIAPVIVSFGLILLAILIIKFDSRQSGRVVKPVEWTLLIAGAFTIILSFCWEYSGFVLAEHSAAELFSLSVNDSALFDVATEYVPIQFNWLLFWTGMALPAIAMTTMFRRMQKLGKQQLIIS